MKLNKWIVNAATAQAYKDGKQDAEAEHDKMCETCIHKVSASDIAQIRADAIEEFEKAIRVETLMPAWCYMLIRGIKKKLLRGQSKDGRTEHNPG